MSDTRTFGPDVYGVGLPQFSGVRSDKFCQDAIFLLLHEALLNISQGCIAII